jgi:FkbM family methyltransferase
MGKLAYLTKLNWKPRLKNAIRAVLKTPSHIGISPAEVIEAFGPDKLNSFVSIGANDGVKNDHLKLFIDKFEWQGILIEPMPENFTKLQENFRDKKNLKLENIGIAETEGIMDFYHLKDIRPEEPDWYDQVGSFDKETFYKNIEVVPSLLDRVGIAKIPASRLDTVLERNGLRSVDLIMIDTEGYDYRILKTIDLSKISPKIIIFEYEWLTNYETKQAITQLTHAGYRTILNGMDCISINRNH